MKTFEQWYNTINEELAAEPVATTVDTQATADVEVSTETSRDAMMHDVDAIMTSLETLAAELKEELESFDAEELNEAGDSVAKKIVDFTIRAPKARKAQAKVNKFNLKISDVEDMESVAKGDAKDKLKAKLTVMKQQAKDLQDAVDDKLASKGEIVQTAQKSEKIKGQIAVLKAKMGETDNKEKAQDIKQQAQKLKQRLQDEEAALKSMEPEKKEEPKKEEPKQEAPKEEPKKEEPKEEPKQESPKEEPAADDTKDKAAKVAEVENDIAEYGKNIEDTNQEIRDAQTKIKQLEAEKAKATDPTNFEKNIEKIKKRIQQDQEDVKDMQASRNALKKELAKLSTKEQLAIRADLVGLNEMAVEIISKEDWQVAEGTALYTKYNTVITKAEMTSLLNESINLSIKDRFSKLI